MAGQLPTLGRSPPVAFSHKAKVRHAIAEAQYRALAVDRLIAADPLTHRHLLLQSIGQEGQIIAVAMHIQPVEQATRLDFIQNDQQGFVGFVVALISLSALRNFGPVLFYVGLAIFAAVGLVIAGAIMGAVV